MRAPSNVSVSLIEALNDIKSGKYKSLIEQARALYAEDKKKYKAFKDNLPVFVFGGTFNGSHALQNIINYNKIVTLDIDGLTQEKLLYLCESLSKDKFIFSHFISPSGVGIKALVKIGNDMAYHKQVFKFFKNYFVENYDTILDDSGSNPNRTCYVSYDENLYLNLDSEVFTLQGEVETVLHKKIDKKNAVKQIIGNNKNLLVSFGLNNQNDRLMMQRIIKYLKKHGKSITSTHNQWYKCAYAIAKTFSYDVGKRYYKELCQMDGQKYDEAASEEKLIYCYQHRDTEGGITFSTITFYAEQEGFINFDKTTLKKAEKKSPVLN
jgi:hypothetical protein